jgi:hypothetical protein
MLDNSSDSGPALRRALRSRTRHPALNQSRFQITPDQFQHPFVLHPAPPVPSARRGSPGRRTFPSPSPRPTASLRLRSAVRPAPPDARCVQDESPSSTGKFGFEQRSRNRMQRLLNQSIHHRRDARCPYPALRLRDFHVTHRRRHVLARQERLSDLRPVRLDPWLQLGDRESIDSRRTFVRTTRSCAPSMLLRSTTASISRSASGFVRPAAELASAPAPAPGRFARLRPRGPHAHALLLYRLASRSAVLLPCFTFGPSRSRDRYYGLG